MAPSVIFAAVPVINNFTPKSGTNGTGVNITGANFGTFPSNNIVYFGAVRATVNSVSHNTNLSVTVPPGATYAPITVLVNGLVAYSSKPFEPTFFGNGGGFDDTSLAPAIIFKGMPSGPQQVAIGDMDGDGKPDLIINNCYNHNISLFRNISSGGVLTSNSFAARVDLPSVAPADGVDRMYDVKVGDVDGDGKLDIVTLDRIAGQIIVYRNISAPGSLDINSFAPPVFFNVASDPRGIVIADV
ncbi:MAG TPA: FG-GAP-like repeat-containing protein, partial [Candidatus Polarisedimenticolia bacterium]|nr:FG-GAP-like repeat-containing protein [Candidatus Polarisedimenticolia bacterium]